MSRACCEYFRDLRDFGVLEKSGWWCARKEWRGGGTEQFGSLVQPGLHDLLWIISRVDDVQDDSQLRRGIPGAFIPSLF